MGFLSRTQHKSEGSGFGPVDIREPFVCKGEKKFGREGKSNHHTAH